MYCEEIELSALKELSLPSQILELHSRALIVLASLVSVGVENSTFPFQRLYNLKWDQQSTSCPCYTELSHLSHSGNRLGKSDKQQTTNLYESNLNFSQIWTENQGHQTCEEDQQHQRKGSSWTNKFDPRGNKKNSDLIKRIFN